MEALLAGIALTIPFFVPQLDKPTAATKTIAKISNLFFISCSFLIVYDYFFIAPTIQTYTQKKRGTFFAFIGRSEVLHYLQSSNYNE